MYDPSIKLNNNVQYVMNLLKTYGYPEQVISSFKQNIDKILADTKDNNRINTANQYIDQFLGDKSLALQDLRRLDSAPNQQPQKADRLDNNVQYVINTLKTYGYPQQVLDSFKQDVDNILANTKDGNRIDAVNQYIDQFLGDKYLAIQDLRRLDSAPGKPAPNQQPQKAKADADAKAAGGTQGVQGAQAGVKTGNAVVGGGVQGSNNKPGKKPRMSDAEINAFLNEELGGNTTDNGTYASADVPKGGTKTIGYGYDPNPGNVSLAYAMRNAPEQERRNALIDKWNQEHGRSGSTYATPGMSTGGTYATGEGIKDANGNVLTNPGGDWEYQYALRDPQYGLGMMGKMSDAQKKYLQAVADDMGYKYNFTGAARYV